MNNYQPSTDEKPTNIWAIGLSFFVHGALVAALFFGVQWKSEQAGGIPVDVYYGNPAASSPPPPPPVTKPEPTRTIESKQTTKPDVEEEKQLIDPQIAIKDKENREKEEKARLEKERLEKEKLDKLKKQKIEEEQKQQDEKARKDEEEKKKREKKEAEERRAEEINKEVERDLKKVQKQSSDAARAAREEAIRAELEGTRGSPKGSMTGTSTGTQSAGGNAGNRGEDEYKDKIRGKIRGNITLPSGINGNPEAIFEVTQLPTGEILPPVKILKSSGHKGLDEAVERAILKSSPLPKPSDPALFQRTLKIPYRPYEGAAR